MTQPTNTPAANEAANTPAPSETPESWDAWLAAQPEEQRPVITSLFEKQTAGLKSALDKEREDRKAFKTQLDKALKAAEIGSDAEKQLTAMSTQLDASERRADFYEAAAKPEIGLQGVKAAWVLMNAEPERYFDRKGRPDFDLLKQEHPYLFGQAKPVPKANGGNGTQSTPSAAQSMNDWIRSQRNKQ